MRALWIVGWVLMSLFVPSTVGLALAAAFFQSDRLAATAAVLFFTTVAGVFAMACWTTDAKPSPLLPRADRKRLRDEERRIALDAAIRRLEREAGQ